MPSLGLVKKRTAQRIPTWETVTYKPQRPARLTDVITSFRSDKSGGFRFTLADGWNDLAEDALKIAFQSYIDSWRSFPNDHEVILDHYQAEVEEFARLSPQEKETIEDGFFVVIALNMSWLEWSGRVKADEFNGTLFVWEILYPEKSQGKNAFGSRTRSKGQVK